MTWEELVDYVRSLKDVGSATGGDHLDIWVNFDGVRFYKNGLICLLYDSMEPTISENRTPDQMYTIIKALTEKE